MAYLTNWLGPCRITLLENAHTKEKEIRIQWLHIFSHPQFCHFKTNWGNFVYDA